MKNDLLTSASCKQAFSATIIIGIITHFYAISNKFLNHDDLFDMFSDFGILVRSGRWFLKYVSKLSSDWSLPVVNGLIAILAIAISAAIVTWFLQIESKLFIWIIAGIMVTNPSVCCTFPFMHMVDCYFISLLFICIGTLLICLKNNWRYIGIIFIALSLGIYQAYFCFGIGLIFLRCFIMIMKAESSNEICETIKQGIIYSSLFLAGLVVYRVILEVFLLINNTSLWSYRGLDSMGKMSFKELAVSIKQCYVTFAKYFFTFDISYNNSIRLMCNYTCFFSICIISLNIMVKKNSIYKGIMLSTLLLLFPVIVNSIFIMVPRSEPSTLMTYSNSLFYIFFVSLVEHTRGEKTVPAINRILPVAMGCLIWLNILLSNQAYLVMDIKTRYTQAMVNRVWERVETTVGYYEGVPIYFVNPFFNSNNELDNKMLKVVEDLDGISQTDHLFLDMYLIEYLKIYFFVNINYAKQDAINEIKKTEEYLIMEQYPSENSIQFINDVLVVKFNKDN